MTIQWIRAIPWWYRSVPALLAHHQRLFFATVIDYFSFGILLRTLFAPWKRDQLSTQNLSLQERLQVWMQNVLTRFVGATVRSCAILSGLIALLGLSILDALFWATWLVAPVLAIALFALGFSTILGGGIQ